MPDAPNFNVNGNKSKNSVWFGCQEFTSDNTVHGSSDFGCIATGFPLSTKNWVCDSGCTTHVYCDHTMFSPAEGSTISSIGGNASTLGYG